MPSYFTKDTLAFLKELEKHNNKAWFEKNKPRYEEHVKEPSARFAAAVGTKLKLEPNVMRIYRDTRFSRDKSPYKTNVGIGFGHGKAVTAPGYFLHAGPGESAIHAGIWHPEPPVLSRIREGIVAKPAAWKKARAVGLSEDEEKLKRPPRGVPLDHPYAEDLKRKSFTAGIAFKDADITAPDFDKTFLAAAKKLAPLNDFLSKVV
ncbi:MAG: hypothetical protein QOE90_313 [Thermoplasmata archaeon]|jgi:uncharacterized protein (TIGR02453 family)|nr:hypothetical protein [Thermoplasmata archaeon]